MGPIATDAKIAQLLFACHKFIQFMLMLRTKHKNFVSDVDFILSVENCTRAIRFAFDEHHHHQNNNNHNNSTSHSCAMCRGQEYQTQHHHCEGNNHHHHTDADDDDDSFCLSRN